MIRKYLKSLVILFGMAAILLTLANISRVDTASANPPPTSLMVSLWRGDLGYARLANVSSGIPSIGWQPWSGPVGLSSFPGSGDIQAQSMFRVGQTLHQSYWRNNQGYSRTVPCAGGNPDWNNATAWSGPVGLSSFPGSGSIQAQGGVVIGSTLYQEYWRNNQRYSRTVPIVSGQPDWNNASTWSGPVSLSGFPGSGNIQSQSSYVIYDFTFPNYLVEEYWRNNQGHSRTVPIVNGQPDWNNPGPWGGPFVPTLTGSGNVQATAGFDIPWFWCN
ncbi:MAG: hypothetical protein AAF490_18615 [Chloroflexota bacterium]